MHLYINNLQIANGKDLPYISYKDFTLLKI